MIERLSTVIVVIVFFYVTTNAQDHNSFGCGAKTPTQTYLEIAQDMIKKANDSISNSRNQSSIPLDCESVLQSGHNKSRVYTVWPKSRVLDGKSVDVYCDMDTDGGGWTIIQRRGNFSRPKDYFYQNWEAYKNGFGNIEEDFWLGNENIFALTNQRLYSIRFDMKDVKGNTRYALYETFWIDDEDHKYTLHIKGYSGDAGDSMIASHNNRKFSTLDQDNDVEPNVNCAQSFKGGWWYSACHASNLNGLYLRGKHESYADGVVWHTWKGHYESMDTVEIKIRPKNFRRTMRSVELEVTPQ